MAKTKVLITVKTYPTLSAKYDELVCTAGFKEDGTWVRIYPIQFRKLDYKSQYSKYSWIEIDLEKNTSDARKESYRPHSLETMPIVGARIDTSNFWEERKKICLKKVYDNMETLIAEAKDVKSPTSLATFKPTKIIDFIYKSAKKLNWSTKKIAAMKQINLFEKRKNGNFKIVRKLPYKFSYVFEDILGKRRTLMIEDWETGELYWRMFRKFEDEKIACEKVKEKYFDDFAKTKDLHFFLGTTKEHHFTGKNPFIIIGTFHPTIDKRGQISLF